MVKDRVSFSSWVGGGQEDSPLGHMVSYIVLTEKRRQL